MTLIRQLHLFWDTNRTPRLLYHTYWTGESWRTTTAIGQTVGASTLTQAPLIDQHGTIHLSWQNDLGSGTEKQCSCGDGKCRFQLANVYRCKPGIWSKSGIQWYDCQPQ